jgi:hypothetical protein
MFRQFSDGAAGAVTHKSPLVLLNIPYARHWDNSHRRKSAGRPPIAHEIVELVLRMAKGNPAWGYDRIQCAMANSGCPVSDRTVDNILKAHGIEPAPVASILQTSLG